jgi:hypothetical protein
MKPALPKSSSMRSVPAEMTQAAVLMEVPRADHWHRHVFHDRLAVIQILQNLMHVRFPSP